MNIQAVLVPVIVCPPHGFTHRVISNDMAAVFGQLLQQSALGGRQGLGGAILQADRKRKVGQYSLGMKQRLGIAMALLGSPRLLILDEPTNGLDPAGIQEMRALIHNMPDACGATVLISSHLLGEMEQIVSQVGIINHGQLLFEGPLAELQRHSRGNVVLRLLAPDRGAAVLRRYGLTPQPADNGCLLPTMEDARLAALVQDLAAEGAGVVGVERQTKNLEEIFLSLTNTQTGKEVG